MLQGIRKKKDKNSFYELMFGILNFVLIFFKLVIVVLNDKMQEKYSGWYLQAHISTNNTLQVWRVIILNKWKKQNDI